MDFEATVIKNLEKNKTDSKVIAKWSKDSKTTDYSMFTQIMLAIRINQAKRAKAESQNRRDSVMGGRASVSGPAGRSSISGAAGRASISGPAGRSSIGGASARPSISGPSGRSSIGGAKGRPIISTPKSARASVKLPSGGKASPSGGNKSASKIPTSKKAE